MVLIGRYRKIKPESISKAHSVRRAKDCTWGWWTILVI